MAQPARQRPLYPSEVPLKKSPPFDGRTFDGRTDRPTALPSVSPSKHPSPRPLTPTEARLCAWIETHVPGELDRNSRPVRVGRLSAPGFIGTRRFVLKYGAALILESLAEMTYKTRDEYGTMRWWEPRIVSPAQFLHFTVKELAALA